MTVVGKIEFAPRPLSWDSIARRYVEHDTTAQTTFGELPNGVLSNLPDGFNDNAPSGVLECDGPLRWRALPQNDNVRAQDGRHGDFMQTYTGGKFWPLDPRPDEVNIYDVAHSLSLQCRYAGHCERFYSVAEHSVLMARWVSPANRLWALLHDASEAYLVDVPRPLKRHLPSYKEAEAKVMAAICERFGLPHAMPAEVHEADNRIIADELVNMRPMAWHAKHDDPLGVRLEFWSPKEARGHFMLEFERLKGRAAA